MKMMRVLAFSLLIVMMAATVCFADENDGDLSPDEGAVEYIYTDADVELIELKTNAMEFYNSKLQTQLQAVNATKTLSVPVFQQENSYFCGPATVKEVVHYKKGTSKTQSQYAALLGTTTGGTDMPVVDDVLNSELGSTVYAYENYGTYSSWASKVKYSIDVAYPAVLDINTLNNSEFPYNTSGHFLPVSGYITSTAGVLTTVRVTDPHPNYTGASWYSATGLFNASNAHWRQAIIW